MPRSITDLLDAFRDGTMSRRQLLQALAAAAVTVPAIAVAQGVGATRPDSGRVGGGGRGRGGGAQRDTVPLVMPFEPTGWETVWLDHLNYQCADYKKAAAFYATLMGWKVRSDDGKQCMLDIGDDSGGILMRGGLTGSAAGRDHRRRTRRESSAGAARCSTASRGASTPWDAKKVKAELEKRGLNPVADNQGADYRAFSVKDPGRLRRRGHQRHEGAAAAGRPRPASCPRRRHSNRPIGIRSISITSRSRCPTIAEARRSIRRSSAGRRDRAAAARRRC